MVIKICGITRPEDARAAVALGADALGFVFWPKSPRFVDPYRARAIVQALPPFVATVGVFVNQTAVHVNGVASLVRLSVVQLHGDESVSYAAALGRPVLKAIGLTAAADGREALGWPPSITLLLDVDDPERRGGTGRTIDWTQAAGIAAARRCILAGGLTPENVGEAVRRVRPFGIDVSSGVESAPGLKDRDKMEALFEAVSQAELPQRTQRTQS